MEDETSTQLDEEFKKSLKFIRPYIISLTNPKYITSCRVWLEKMNKCCQLPEKRLRNDYLRELCRQIQNGKLEEPFISHPPEGPLTDLNVIYSSNSWSDLSTVSATTLDVAGSGDSHNEPVNENILAGKYEIQLREQQIAIDELTQQNQFLNERISRHSENVNKNADTGLGMLAGEVEYLKGRLKELMLMKKKLQASHNAVCLQWENNTRSLEVALQEERLKNQDLKSAITTLETKLKNMESHFPPNISLSADQKSLDHEEEVELIKKQHSEVIQNMQDHFSCILQNKESEYEEQMTVLKYSYEQKIQEIYVEADKNYKSKDEEISRLEKMVEVQCDRSQMEQESGPNQETLLEKVTFLQKCILKMEKLLRKYEKHYTKKMYSLKKELQMKENAVQIQLTTQRAQLLSKASSERQAEIETIVSQLEHRYRLLLEDQHLQANAVQQKHINLIKELTEKLEAK